MSVVCGTLQVIHHSLDLFSSEMTGNQFEKRNSGITAHLFFSLLGPLSRLSEKPLSECGPSWPKPHAATVDEVHCSMLLRSFVTPRSYSLHHGVCCCFLMLLFELVKLHCSLWFHFFTCCLFIVLWQPLQGFLAAFLDI